jgi:hypothetical protein
VTGELDFLLIFGFLDFWIFGFLNFGVLFILFLVLCFCNGSLLCRHPSFFPSSLSRFSMLRIAAVPAFVRLSLFPSTSPTNQHGELRIPASVPRGFFPLL